MLTVAYGSNVDAMQMASRCPGARQVGEVVLDGFVPGFGGPSRLRGGGVATLRQGEGSVHALVWEVDSLRALDRLEGHPHFYERVKLPAGWCYLLRENITPLAPSADYLELVCSAHLARGWSTSAWRAAAVGLPAALLFVYGSLRRGGAWHHVLADAIAVGAARTRSEWRIVPVGPYPGMVPGTESVVGELYLVSTEVLHAVDALEEHPALYRRSVVLLEDGTPCEGYVYGSSVLSSV